MRHRGEIRSGADLKNEAVYEAEVIQHFSLTIIECVESGKPWSQNRLDELEGKLQKNLMTMDYNGGMNIRDEVRRRRRRIGV